MKPLLSLSRIGPRPRLRLATLVLAASTVLGVGAIGVGNAGALVHQTRLGATTHHQLSHKHKTKKKTKAKTAASTHPCLEGNWAVTSLTLSTSGLTFTGGAGTTVDIMSNGNALGNFTPGAPLTGSEGSAKFSGTITDHYGFSAKTTARSGSFPVTPVSNSATITVAGVTRAVTSEDEQGAYVCTGKDLSLTFTSGTSTLKYEMSPAS